MIFLSRADVADDVGGAKTCCHVAMYIHAMWRRHPCVRMCTCVRTCLCVISEIKHAFSRYELTH